MTWHQVRRLGGIALLVTSVGYVAWRIISDGDAREALGAVGAVNIAVLVVLQLFYLVPQAYRYLVALRLSADQPIPPLGWFRLFVLGRFLNSLIPQAGTVYRGVKLRDDYHVPITRYLGGFVSFTWLSTVLNLIVASVVIAILEPELRIGEARAVFVTGLVLVVVAVGPPLGLWVVERMRRRDGFLGWARRRFEELLSSAVSLARAPRELAQFTAVGLAGLAVALLMFWRAFESLDLDVSVSTLLLFFVLLQLSTYVNITPGNLGVLELGFGALGAELGIGLVGGLLVAAILRITGYLALLLAGLAVGGLEALRSVRESDQSQAE